MRRDFTVIYNNYKIDIETKWTILIADFISNQREKQSTESTSNQRTDIKNKNKKDRKTGK